MEPLPLTIDLLTQRFVYPGDLGVGLRELNLSKGAAYNVNLSFSSGYSGAACTPSGLSWDIAGPGRKGVPLVSLSNQSGTSFPLFAASPVMDYALVGREQAVYQSYVSFSGGGVSYSLSPLTTLVCNNPSLSPQQEYYPLNANPAGYLTSASGGGGGSSLQGSSVLYVDPSGSNGSATLGFPSNPFANISAALNSAASGDTIHVFPGTYNEQITYKNGVQLYLEPGATVTYTGHGSTFTDNSGSIGTFRIAGRGSLQHASTTGAQSVLEIKNNANSIYVECQDIQMSIPSGTAVTGGNTYYASAGPGASGARYYQTAAIFAANGYLQVNCDEILAGYCPVVFRGGNGNFHINVGDNIQTNGSGISAIIVGDGTSGNNTQSEQPGWVTCHRLISDPNERVFSVEGNSQNGVFYIHADRIAGCFEDPNISGGSKIYVDCDLWVPQINHDGSVSATTRNLCTLGNSYSYYGFKVGDMRANGPVMFQLNYINSTQAPANVFDIDYIQQYGAGACLQTATNSQGYVYFSSKWAKGNIVYNGGYIFLHCGYLDGSLTLNFSPGLVVIDSIITTLVTNGHPYVSIGSSDTTYNAQYPNGALLADDSGNLYFSNGQVALGGGGVNFGNGQQCLDGGGNIYNNQANFVVDSNGNLYYPDGNSYLADSTPLLYYPGGQPGSTLADSNGNLYFAGQTSDPHVAGQIWNDAGTLKVSAG